MEVQVFGTRRSAETRKALRFFAERRITTHFVDLDERAASRGELMRFVQKFGVHRLVDRESRRFQDMGLARARLPDERWLEKIQDEPLLLVMPLTRWQHRIAIGVDEAAWKEWIAAAQNSPMKPTSGSRR